MKYRDKILVDQIQVGMYICKLDRPWLETPFPFQGFYLRTKHEINEVQRFCDFVYIDCKKGTQTYKEPEINRASPLLVREKINQTKSKHLIASDLRKIVVNIGKYEEQTKPFKKEINNAKVLFSDLARSIEQISFNIRVGKRLNISEAKSLTRSVVISVIKNPNTMIWLSQLKDKGDYTYNHSLRSSILATVFGRHLGLSEDELVSLATGVLLADIGKTKINRKLLNSSQKPNQSEKILLKSHVELGVEMLATEKNVDHSTLVIVETHHERFNGTGYPYALVGAEIPFFGQIAGLVDVFDAITSKKSYGKQLTPAQAMDWLYGQRDKLFSGKLIDDFIQAIGLYPAGTLVQLTDKSIGLVVSHNPDKRLRPEVFLLKDSNSKNLNSTKTVDLSKRAFLSKIDRPMVRKAILPEQLNLTGHEISEAIQNNKKVRKALFG
ncbi:MAG: DUF3391 domain-containing protein [Alcanivoracaceae bacterium]|nr:DUF3391 domain-containing protein [Alcanivoracaceae bacterium]